MKSLPSLLSIINTVLILALGLFLFFNSQKGEEKVDFVFIDNYKLFTGFNMSKELNAKYGKQIDAQKKKLDSIYLVYQSAAEFRNEEDMSRLQLQLQQEDQKLKKDQEYFSNEVSKQVWERLNGYIQEFGKENDLEIIFGAQGKGNVMYSKDYRDYTLIVTEYANSKYEGND
ncbi:MAG: hypothetical protein HRT68_13300 [Flavobacteriaceae bacterium]|nr:hypothetical protein [Flavobacteriaceae bacterium]